ncbi:DUF5133 domain-containing protein [Streptomyces puniciscabiei]|uniref:DUF5133 domain-containing protein n=1 Tax=Streptomyces puniciscabiei TaxID=164348 RepID=UPI00379F1EE2
MYARAPPGRRDDGLRDCAASSGHCGRQVHTVAARGQTRIAGPGKTARLSSGVVAVLLPAEREPRAVLARFAAARFRHDLRPTGQSSRDLEDTSRRLCVMTGTQSVDRAPAAADALLEQLRGDRQRVGKAGRTLAARPAGVRRHRAVDGVPRSSTRTARAMQRSASGSRCAEPPRTA